MKNANGFNSSNSAYHAIAAMTIAMLGVIVLAAVLHPKDIDYIAYWSSGKLLMHHANPYAPAKILALQKAQGFSLARPDIMLNPPWALFLAAPLGLGGIHIGLFLWLVAALGCTLISVQLLNVPARERLFAFLFAPLLACIFSGQSSPFLLLGYSLFLRFERRRPFLAGTCLLLMAIKPHLFAIFWVLLLIDCLYRRRLLVLAGGIFALAIGTIFSMCFDARIWTDYIAMLREYQPGQGFLPTPSMFFQMLVDSHAGWLIFVPTVLAILWGLWYYAHHREDWDWTSHGMLVMLVTILVSPFIWITDQIVLLPCLALALTVSENRRYSGWALLAINSVVLYLIAVSGAQLRSPVYFWTPVAWLAWFVYAARIPQRQREESAAKSSAPAITGQVG